MWNFNPPTTLKQRGLQTYAFGITEDNLRAEFWLEKEVISGEVRYTLHYTYWKDGRGALGKRQLARAKAIYRELLPEVWRVLAESNVWVEEMRECFGEQMRFWFQKPCDHPPQRQTWWHAADRTLCGACNDCGAVLAGSVEL